MGHRAGSLWNLFHLASRTTRWHRYFYNISKFGIWPCLTFDPLTMGHRAGSLWNIFHLASRTTRWHRYFCNISKFGIWPCLTFDPLTMGHRAGSLWNLFHLSLRTTRWHRYFCNISKLNIWPLDDPNWPFDPKLLTGMIELGPVVLVTKYDKNTPIGWWDIPFLHIN